MKTLNRIILYFIITLLPLFAKAQSDVQNNPDTFYLWIYNSKAYVISDTILKHDTLATLTWMDSLKYRADAYSLAYDLPSKCLYNKEYWYKIICKNKTGWIKCEDVALCKQVIKGGSLFVFIKGNEGEGGYRWKQVVVLNKYRKLVKNLYKTTISHSSEYYYGNWIKNNQYFIFSDYYQIYSYDVQKNALCALDSAAHFTWNDELQKLITLSSPTSWIIKMKSMNIDKDRQEKKDLFFVELPPGEGHLGREGESYNDVHLQIDNYNGTKCYSFWIGTKYGFAQMFIDWQGKHLRTKYEDEKQ